MKKSKLRMFAGELIGTIGLMFVWTGMFVIPHSVGAQFSPFELYLTLGIAVAAISLAIGKVSGAHLNPAVTFGFWVSRRIRGRDMFLYFACQFVAAFLVIGIFLAFFPVLGEPDSISPSISIFRTLVFEIIVNFFLVFVILRVSKDGTVGGLRPSIAAGLIYFTAGIITSPLHYPSIHIARASAMALYASRHDELWIYVVAALIGSSVAAFASKMMDKIDPNKKKERPHSDRSHEI
ncbi:MAG: hypothetical protein A2Y33_02210 [Spirochaetes bacterium GWF1_51_8]|nr:MAG: hypothetical protein A2Y33_02210 [Spirochaetes bacterium GWF1_51_8]